MKLRYHKDWRGNFGDDLNLPFFSEIFPEYEERLEELTLFGIGTLLNDVHGSIQNAVIFGSGYGYGNSITFDRNTTRILGVRGPITAKALGLDAEQHVIGDPALYLPRMPSMSNGKSCAGALPVVAIHHRTAEMWDLRNAGGGEVFFLDPGDVSIEDYIATIRDAPYVFTESLHGAIIAATFGTPFLPVSIKTSLESTKWLDFAQSLGIDLTDTHHIGALRPRQLRRYQIAAAVRTPSMLLRRAFRYGFEPSAGEKAELIGNLMSLRKSGVPIVASRGKVVALQDKIEGAIEKLKEIV